MYQAIVDLYGDRPWAAAVVAEAQQKLAAKYCRTMSNHDKSHALFTRAKQLMPGGVNSPARAFGGVGGEPIFIDRGEGAYLCDVDGNRYIDYIGSWGPMILGHGHPAVVAALEAAIHRGTSFGAPTAAENELAELIIEAVPSVEKVRLVNSGTEATMSAIRLARGFTGRDVIVKFAGNYHGHVDSLLVAAGSSAATLGVPNSPGVTAGTTRDTLVAAYNDAGRPRSGSSREHGPRIAGVIFEPVVGNMGFVVPTPEFLAALARADAAARRAVDLRRSDDRLSRRLRRRTAAARHPARPDDARQDRRRRPAGRRLRRPGRDHGPRAARPAKSFRPARSAAIRWPPPPASPRSARSATIRPTTGSNNSPRDLAAGLRAAATAAGVPHQFARVGSMLTLFFNGRAGHRLGHGQPLRHGRASPATSGACSTAASTCRAASTKRCSSPPPTPRPTSTRRSPPRTKSLAQRS